MLPPRSKMKGRPTCIYRWIRDSLKLNGSPPWKENTSQRWSEVLCLSPMFHVRHSAIQRCFVVLSLSVARSAVEGFFFLSLRYCCISGEIQFVRRRTTRRLAT